MVRKLFIIVGAVVVVLVPLLYGILAGLILVSSRDALVQAALRSVSNSLQGSLEVERIRGSLLSAPVVQNIVLRDGQGTVIGQIDALRLRYNLLSMLRLRMMVHEIEIVQPRLTVLEEPDGTLNISRALSSVQPRVPDEEEEPSAGFGLPLAIVVEDVRLRDGAIDLGLTALPGVQQVQALQVHLQAQLDAQGMRAQLHQVTAQTTPAQVDLHTLHGSFQEVAGVRRVDGLRLEMGHTILTADGVLPSAQETADFALQIDPLDVTEIGRLIQNDDLHGQLHLSMSLEGPPEALVANLQLNPVEAPEKGTVALRAEVDTVATLPRYRAQVDVNHLDLTAFLQKPAWQSDVNLQARLEGEGIASHELQSDVRVDIYPSHVGTITLQPSLIDLQAQQGRFQVRHFDVETSLARVTATGAVDLAGRSDLQYELTAQLEALRQLLELEHLHGGVHLQGDASGEWPDLSTRGTLDVRDVRYQDYGLDALQLTYEGAQLGAQPQVSTQLQLQRAHLGDIPVAQIELQGAYDDVARQVRFGLSLEQSADYGMSTQGTLTLLDTGQRLDIETLQLQLATRPWQSTAPLQVIHEDDRLQLTTLRLEHAEESLEISGGIIGEQLEDLRLVASQIDLAYLQPLMDLPEPVNGRASLQVLLSGTLPAPQLHVDLTVQPEGQPDLPFQRVQTSLAYAQQHLQGEVRILQADREVLAIDLRLPIDLALTALTPEQRLVEGPLGLDVHLREPDLGAFSRWYKGLPPLAGTLQGAMSLQGTAAQLGLNGDLHLQNLGVEHTVEQLVGAVNISGQVVAAPSVQDLRRAIQQGDLTLMADALALRSPLLQGHIPAQEAPAQPFEVRDVALQAAGQWSPQGIQGTLQTLSLQATAFGLPPTHLLVEAGLTPERLDLQRLQVRLPQSEIRGRGSLTMGDQQMQLRLEIPRLQLDDLPITLPPDLPRQLQGTIVANGTLSTPQVEARLTYAGARIGANFAAQLQEPLPRYQARLRLEALDVARLWPNMAGEIETTLQLQGQGFTEEERRAALNLAVDSRNLTVAPGLTVRLQANVAGDVLNIEGLRVTSTPLQLVAGGTLSTTQAGALTYSLTLGDLAPLQPLVGAELQASGSLTGRVEGTLDALQTTGNLRIEAWRYADVRGQSLVADFSASQLPAAPQGSITLQLANVEAPSLPATSLRMEANYVPPQGQVTATVTAGPYQGTMFAGRMALNDAQRITVDPLRLQARDLAWENEGAIQVIRSPHGDVQIQRFTLRSGEQRLNVEGTLSHTGALTAAVQVQQLQIAPNVQAAMPDTAVPDGQLSLDFTLGGTLQQPQGQGTLQLTSLSWHEQPLGEMHVTLDLANETARTDLRWRLQERELLQVQGTVGLAAEGALAMQIRSVDLSLEMLRGLVPGVTQSAGTLNLDLRANGTLRQPRLNGSLVVDHGTLQLAATGERYRDIQVRIILAGERIDIQQLQVGSQTGVLEVLGWAQLAEMTLQHADITIQARDFTAMNTPFIEAVTTMDLSVRGSLQSMLATGTVTVPRLRVQVTNIPGTGPPDIEPWQLTVQGVYGPGPEAVSVGNDDVARPLQVGAPLPFLRADIHVDIPRNAWVHAPGTAVEMSGDIDITKELEQPFILSGGIAIERGFASVLGKRFVIREGQVTFTGTPDINPVLNLTVTHTVSNYLVEIHVGGHARQPQLSFSSTPELEETDILSLLIVGKTMDRLTSSEQQDLSGQLGGVVGSVVASQLQEALGGALGLDTFTIGAGEGAGAGSVSIGQYVTQDIFVSYEVGLGREGGNRFGIEYSITPRLKLKGSSGDTGASAIDFLWRRDY